MRLYESRQSATSPIKYKLEMTPEEAGLVQKELIEIIRKIESLRKEKKYE